MNSISYVFAWKGFKQVRMIFMYGLCTLIWFPLNCWREETKKNQVPSQFKCTGCIVWHFYPGMCIFAKIQWWECSFLTKNNDGFKSRKCCEHRPHLWEGEQLEESLSKQTNETILWFWWNITELKHLLLFSKHIAWPAVTCIFWFYLRFPASAVFDFPCVLWLVEN